MNEKKREQENVLRLVKKSRKGILRVVFSRFGLMALLLVLELVQQRFRVVCGGAGRVHRADVFPSL